MRKSLLIGFLFFWSSLSLAVPTWSWADHAKFREEVASFYDIPNAKDFIILPIAAYQQTEDFTCGAATVMSLLRYYNRLTDQEMNRQTEIRIAAEMKTNKIKGASPDQITRWLKAHGFKVISGEHGSIKMLKNNLKRGIPTIVCWSDWGGHWVLVTGYDARAKSYLEDKDTIFFADPASKYNNVKNIHGLTAFNPDRFASMWVEYQYFKPGRLIRGVYIIAMPITSAN